MRVTHAVRSDSFAGVERYVCDVVTVMAGRGHEVTVIGGEAARMRAELPDGVRWAPAATVAGVARALVAGGPRDVVHVHMTAAELAGVLTRPAHRAGVVSTRHFAAQRGGSPLARAVGRGLLRGIDVQVSISDFVAGAVDGPSVVVPNAVRPAAQAPLTARTVVVLQRLETEKSPDTALRAWAASTAPGRGWTLVIAGRGRLEPQLRKLADELGIASSVRFVGYVQDTGALLDGASLLLATAPAEPFGLAVVEAMARGIPVIAGDGGAHRETVAPDGLLFPPGDVGACAGMLDRVVADEETRRRIGGALRRRQQRHFDLDRHVDALTGIYDRVAPGR